VKTDNVPLRVPVSDMPPLWVRLQLSGRPTWKLAAMMWLEEQHENKMKEEC